VTWKALRGHRREAVRRLAAGLLAAGLLCGSASAGDAYESQRRAMVEQQIKQRGITKPEVLAAMEQVPRHMFVPDSLRADAYSDRPLPLGQGRTVYQPYMVALMTSLLDLKHGDKVLEIGTGSGYQAAVLAQLVGTVCSIEVIPELARRASEVLSAEGCHNVSLRTGNGVLGWPEEAPFDAIIVTAAAPRIPPTLIEQLGPNGRMVIPVGAPHGDQELQLLKRNSAGEVTQRRVLPVAFVPLTGG
jgi:protein-L-isoaspartate(D-aspartate) O-methyltransferase